MSNFIQITTTSDKKEILQSIGSRLIEARLAACVQISGPLESIFRWNGKIDTAQEWSCTIKSVAQHQVTIQSTIQEIHNYEEPEIIIQQISGGSQGYLNWIKQQTQT